MKTKIILSSAAAFALLMGIPNLNAMPMFSGGESSDDKGAQGKSPAVKPKSDSAEKEGNEAISYGWGAYFTNKYFAWTANTVYEKQKFPEITPSSIIKFMEGETTIDNATKISFKFTTGSSVVAPDYYKGTAYVDEIDYGTYSVPFLGADKGFDNHATYMSLANEVGPYQFIDAAFIKAKCDGSMCKGDLLKGSDTKTRLIYVLHNERENKYLRIILKRDQ